MYATYAKYANTYTSKAPEVCNIGFDLCIKMVFIYHYIYSCHAHLDDL